MLNNQQLFERRMHVKMDRLADPLADLAKNKLPEGLKGIGMGLGMNGQPLVDVASKKFFYFKIVSATIFYAIFNFSKRR